MKQLDPSKQSAKVWFTHFKSCDYALGKFSIVLLFAPMTQLRMTSNMLEKGCFMRRLIT